MEDDELGQTDPDSDERRLNIQMPAELVGGTYANFANVSFSPYEFTLTFARIEHEVEEGDVPGAVVARVNASARFIPELIAALQDDIPLAFGDGKRITQCLMNLVGNALKFTQEGEITLQVHRLPAVDKEEGAVRLRFTVTDTGIGIPQEAIDRLFRSFSQLDGSYARKYGGTGLGLAISKQLVEMMGGTIGVTSQVGKGSTFAFEIPFPVTAEGGDAGPAIPRPVAALLRGQRILLVDDNEASRGILAAMLSEWDVVVEVFAGAVEAEARLQSAQSAGEPFAAALIDADMPGSDGLDLYERLRQESHSAVPVVLLLNAVDLREKASCVRQLEGLGCLPKPVRRGRLLAALTRALSTEPAETGFAAAKPDFTQDEAGPLLQVLVAEDNLVNQKLALRMLEKRGHVVTVVANGKEAVAAFEKGFFDLILMDIQMPEMDGFAATAAIRALEKKSGRRTPIIALTAHALKGYKEQCLAAGMDGYCAKPLKAEELFALMAELTAQGRVS